jgi:hypothetical protein
LSVVSTSFIITTKIAPQFVKKFSTKTIFICVRSMTGGVFSNAAISTAVLRSSRPGQLVASLQQALFEVSYPVAIFPAARPLQRLSFQQPSFPAAVEPILNHGQSLKAGVC